MPKRVARPETGVTPHQDITDATERPGVGDRSQRAVLFVDVVGSVRLMEVDEVRAVAQIRSVLGHVANHVVPGHGGRIVKELGDGLLADFASIEDAVRAALTIQARRPADDRPALRVGIDAGDVIVTQRDLFGQRVNIAARLMEMADPGGIVASASVRDALASELAAEFEDLGDCYLRHVTVPVRAYRIYPPGTHNRPASPQSSASLLPTIAVLPPAGEIPGGPNDRLGDAVAEELIVCLARSRDLNVISRLSCSAFRDRSVSLTQVGDALRANFVLSGTYHVKPARLTLDLELADVSTGRVLWADRIIEPIETLFDPDRDWMVSLVAQVRRAILRSEMERARTRHIVTLDNHTLLMSAIDLMHRLSRKDFEVAYRLLDTLIDREAGQPMAQAWMAKWYVLRLIQGWSDDPARDAYLARECTQRALDVDPENSLALVMDGEVNTHLVKRLDVAEQRYRAALDSNPNEPLGRLMLGTLHAFRGEGAVAVEETERARMLTPLDPHKHYFDSLAASAAIAAGNSARALELANASLRINRAHSSTLRVKAVAQVRLGNGKGAREAIGDLLRIEPGFTVKGWLARTPSAAYPVGRAFAESLRDAGAPA